MHRVGETVLNALAVMLVGLAVTAAQPAPGVALYGDNCAVCHHPKRYGLTAPPLLPGTLSISNREKIADVIANGLPATQMPGFAEKLTNEEIQSIAEYILTPAGEVEWTFDDINNSRNEYRPASPLKPFKSDIENVTLAVERGKKEIAVLDGDTLERLASFNAGDVHGGPKFTQSLERVYSVSRDGIATRFDIKKLSAVAQIKAGVNSRAIAVSQDGETVAVANVLPPEIVFLDKDLKPVNKLKIDDKVGGFYSFIGPKTFICSFRGKPEMWIIDATGEIKVDKIALPVPFEDYSINYPLLIGTKRSEKTLYIFDMEKRQTLMTFPADGMPHLASVAFWKKGDELLAAVNFIEKPLVAIYSLTALKQLSEITLPTPGFFVRTHHATPYLWIDTGGDEIVLAEKDNPSVTRTIRPLPGRKAMHVEFTKDGSKALVSIPGKGGAVVIYDVATLKAVKTLPFENPAGKYNASLKTFPELSVEKPSSPGKQVFQKFCMGCHHETFDAFGPPFAEIAKKRDDGQIRFHIRFPEQSSSLLKYRRNSMPKIKLSPKELDDIVTYIKSFGRS